MEAAQRKAQRKPLGKDGPRAVSRRASAESAPSQCEHGWAREEFHSFHRRHSWIPRSPRNKARAVPTAQEGVGSFCISRYFQLLPRRRTVKVGRRGSRRGKGTYTVSRLPWFRLQVCLRAWRGRPGGLPMGMMSRSTCEDCGYSASVSGERNFCFMAVVQTMTC